ncbi:MAG: GDP-mannose 4,6-dehydratase [Oligoflexia bacterium]|nr:GDP-mannose 4,6-dehydratase [Oligoflexia bacterium]
MKILITGGAGFIGSHLCDRLIGVGAGSDSGSKHEIFVIDDLSTGSIENIEHLKVHKNFHYVIDTITNKSLMRELIDKCDVIYHLAAAVGVKLIMERPVHTIETNIYGTELIFQCAAQKGKRTIIASTSEVYGKSSKIPFSEDDDLVLGPTNIARWSYACSKAIDEYLAHAYWNEKRLPVTVVRFFNTVGPRQVGHYGMVIPRFIKSALAGENLTIYGDGHQSRCFGHVNDIVRALDELKDANNTLGETINLGQPEEISINELAVKIIEMCESKSKLQYVSFDEAYGPGFEDMKKRVPDISKAKRLFGFTPKYKLNDILRDTISYHRQHQLSSRS